MIRHTDMMIYKVAEGPDILTSLNNARQEAMVYKRIGELGLYFPNVEALNAFTFRIRGLVDHTVDDKPFSYSEVMGLPLCISPMVPEGEMWLINTLYLTGGGTRFIDSPLSKGWV